MKKVLVVFIFGMTALFFTGFRSQDSNVKFVNDQETDELIPENVMTVLQKSCFGCHNSESKNEDGKKAVEFDKLESLKTFALLGKLDEIEEVVEEGKMPPKKFLKNYPDNALSEEDKEVLLNWVRETASGLKGE